MKNIFLISVLAMICHQSYGQKPTVAKEKMTALQSWVGKWRGESIASTQDGKKMKGTVEENVQSKLDGTILLVEGLGKATRAGGEEFVVHNALGVLAYDQPTTQYKFMTYLADGRGGEAWFKILADNQYQWGFETPYMRMKYDITIDPVKKTWHEVGQYSKDGSSWSQVIEMNLTKVE